MVIPFGRYGLFVWPMWLWPIWFVADMVCGRYGTGPFVLGLIDVSLLPLESKGLKHNINIMCNIAVWPTGKVTHARCSFSTHIINLLTYLHRYTRWSCDETVLWMTLAPSSTHYSERLYNDSTPMTQLASLHTANTLTVLQLYITHADGASSPLISIHSDSPALISFRVLSRTSYQRGVSKKWGCHTRIYSFLLTYLLTYLNAAVYI